MARHAERLVTAASGSAGDTRIQAQEGLSPRVSSVVSKDRSSQVEVRPQIDETEKVARAPDKPRRPF